MSLTVPAPVVERTVECYSRTDPNGTPYFNTCSMMVGDGTMKIEWEKGRADVPASLAQLLAGNPHIHVPGIAVQQAGVQAAPVDAALAAENETLRARLGDMEAMLKRLTAAPASPVKVDSGPDPEAKERVTLPEDVPDKVRLAMEHLAAEGESVPEPGSALPAPASIAALEALTADGQARCQAVKADGSQCSNSALGDTGACAIGRHQVKAPE